MNKRNEKKLTRREIALQNLEKANEAKKQKIAQPKGPDNWETRSQTRLERIMEKAEKALAKANNMDGADISKLAVPPTATHLSTADELTTDNARKKIDRSTDLLDIFISISLVTISHDALVDLFLSRDDVERMLMPWRA